MRITTGAEKQKEPIKNKAKTQGRNLSSLLISGIFFVESGIIKKRNKEEGIPAFSKVLASPSRGFTSLLFILIRTLNTVPMAVTSVIIVATGALVNSVLIISVIECIFLNPVRACCFLLSYF